MGGSRPSALDGNFSLGESSSSAVHADYLHLSSISSAPLAGVSDETDPDLEQVKDLTLASYLSFVSCKRLSVVRACLFDHGVDTNGLEDEECEEALVCHLLNGLCARSVCVHEQVPGCLLNQSRAILLDLSVLIISTLLENVSLSSFKLQELCTIV